MDELLQSNVIDRLDLDKTVPAPIADLVLAALVGQIEECLGGKSPLRPATTSPKTKSPVRAYVESIRVEGFRGIGPKAELSLRPGPGLTLIVGRNGSGKSSFAEALELLITGDNQRWSSKRTKIWKEGWRNLHHPDVARIEAKILIDGKARPSSITRVWKAGDELEKGEATVSSKSKVAPISSLGWGEPLSTYRPFLSYNELGSMLEEGPSKLFDALASILGLEELLAAADALKETRTLRTRVHKEVADQLTKIRELLKTHPDERANQCLELLKGKKWSVDLLQAVISGQSTSAVDDSELKTLRNLADLSGPDPSIVTPVLQELKESLAAQESFKGTDADKARRRAEILEKALDLHRHDGDTDCPVCGRKSALNDTWRGQAEQEVRELRKEAEAAAAAHRRVRDAERTARQLIAGPPSFVTEPAVVELWTAWNEGASKAGRELVQHLESLAQELDNAIRTLRNKARVELQQREDRWRPIADALAEWLPGARKMTTEVEAVGHLKSAEDWLRTIGTTIHNERFLPIKEKVRRIWELLRTQSHVDLEDITFEGKSTARRINLDVTVDGTKGAALGVMSQGELNALALSLFLPRATLEPSPFRFLFIDDPVQSMDPARVDGLARVLDEVAQNRQVVVFTHDDRLPEAIRRLQIEARIIEVLRREGSVVELREVKSPGQQYLDDAFSLVMTKELPSIVTERVVPGLCRQSLEAACIEVVRRRRLTKGNLHDEIEQLLAMHTKLLPRLALALYDDPDKAGDVYTGVKNRFGSRQVDTVRTCNDGAHNGFPHGDPINFVRDVESLAQKILGLS